MPVYCHWECYIIASLPKPIKRRAETVFSLHYSDNRGSELHIRNRSPLAFTDTYFITSILLRRAWQLFMYTFDKDNLARLQLTRRSDLEHKLANFQHLMCAAIFVLNIKIGLGPT